MLLLLPELNGRGTKKSKFQSSESFPTNCFKNLQKRKRARKWRTTQQKRTWSCIRDVSVLKKSGLSTCRSMQRAGCVVQARACYHLQLSLRTVFVRTFLFILPTNHPLQINELLRSLNTRQTGNQSSGIVCPRVNDLKAMLPTTNTLLI